MRLCGQADDADKIQPSERRFLIVIDHECFLIKNAYNEVVNGLVIDGFVGRLGAEWESVHALQNEVGFVRVARPSGSDRDRPTILMSTQDRDLVARALVVVLNDINETECQTRLGAETEEASRLAEKIETLLGRPVAARTII